MTRLIGSEFLKLRTTRTFYALMIIAAALVILPTIPICAFVKFKPGDDGPLQALLFFIGGLVQSFALVLGILAATTEFRHGTITPTLLVTPVRGRLLTAKLEASVIAGLILGLLTTVLIAAIVGLFGSLRDLETEATSSLVIKEIIGGTLATGLFAALGLGLGAIVRNQVGAIIGLLVYMLLIEPLSTAIPTVGDQIGKYGLGGTSGTLSATSTGNVLEQVPGGLLLAAYTAVFCIAGFMVMRRRDITA
jgi:ABC-2 type transport system permease protein